MNHYKVLTKAMAGPYRDFDYELGIVYTCEDFDPNPLSTCSRGFYATPTIEGCLYANLSDGNRVFECETGGQEVMADRFKHRFETIKLVRELDEPEIRRLARRRGKIRGYNIEEALYPVDPRKIDAELDPKVLDLLLQWSLPKHSTQGGLSILNSIGGSIGDSFGDSVRHSAYTSVMTSVGEVRSVVECTLGEPVGDSAWSAVMAYISTLFPSIDTWEGTQAGENPFRPGGDLWRRGFVPSYDGTTWRLHAGAEMNVVWEGVI